MERRLMGEELEVGLAGVTNNSLPYLSSYLASVIKNTDVKSIVAQAGTLNELNEFSMDSFNSFYWLQNGGKLYRDNGHLLEYATPECQTAKEIVLHDKAAEIIFRKLLNACPEDKKSGVAIIKNNSCYYKNISELSDESVLVEVSWGLHENYLVPQELSVDDVLENLTPHLVARIIYTGAGHIRQSDKGFEYVLSSRAPFVGKLCDETAQGPNKPFILKRQERHVGKNWWRLQIVSTEANMLEAPTYLKFFTNHICLRLIEDGWRLPRNFELFNPPIQFQMLNYDIFCKTRLGLFNSKSITPVEIERLYLQAAKKLSPLSDEERYGLELWEWILDLLSQDLRLETNLLTLVGVLDWATKWHLIRKTSIKNNYGLENPEIIAMNLRYHSLDPSPKESLWARICAKDFEKPFIYHIVSADEISKAVYEAPAGRPRIRGDFVKLVHDFPKIMSIKIDWEGASFLLNDINQVCDIDFGLKDPFLDSSESLEFLKLHLCPARSSLTSSGVLCYK